MILIDYSQACIAAIMAMTENPRKVNIDIIRHVVLNMIRSYKKKYGAEFGEVIICTDSKNNWRKKKFPLYKAKRKTDRAKSPYDWDLIFKSINQIRTELKDYFPYRVLEIEGAEADDIIAALVEIWAPASKPTVIISSDNDFLQLQKYKHVKQFSPILNKYITTDDPKRFLEEHILDGDRGDGVPNFLSPDDTFITGERQKPITKKKLEIWLESKPEDYCDNVMLSRYKRNKEMIDLTMIPAEIKSAILQEFEVAVPKNFNRKRLTEYFMEMKLANLFDVIGDFT